ncbi:MAG TPA: PD-(D/E)XK nuclease family protein, partial [Campylobacterales bacterium]|nr:PD-(D/E)XK nuclease family protein [Campylobacterales bacterium]
MKILKIYPTSRAIRNERLKQREQDTLLPTLMRVDEFESRSIILPELSMVDSLQRTLLLQEASNFDAFKSLKINRELIRFFTKSDAIFKFFEELSHEKVSFDALVEGDAYVEFAEHIEVLEQLLQNYEQLLRLRGMSDRVFVPKSYRLNRGFVERYEGFEFYLEGYLSYFELGLMQEIAQYRPFIVHIHTSKFNQKIQERFLELGIELENDAMVSFDLQSKQILSSEPNPYKINAKVLAVEERLAQIPVLLESVQKMVDEGISPDEIVVILPDESFKAMLQLYDKFNNFNFAMGIDFSTTKHYKQLDALYAHWQNFSAESHFLLKKYDIATEKVNEVNISQKCRVDEFFSTLEAVELKQNHKDIVESVAQFSRVFSANFMSIKSWLFLWLKKLSKITLDDVRGGKVTVMGALETRGVAFRGVVVVDFNDGVVPAIPAKDSFLNSSLRKFAKLPTKNDREALQKQIYKRILEQAEHSTIIYSKSNNKSPASYLYELGLGLGEDASVNLALLYNEPNMVVEPFDPVIENFDATAITWSATRLKTFLSCKRKYYYNYVLDLRAKEEDDLNEGAFLHKLLEHLFKEKTFFDSAEGMKHRINLLLDELLPEESAKLKYMKLLWKKRLEKFVETQIHHFRAGWRVAAKEEQIVGSIGGINFKGVVDRIDQDSTGTLVLDYKSGSLKEANKKGDLEKLTDFQMTIYSELL